MPRTAIKLRFVSMTFAKTISTESANELIAVHIVCSLEIVSILFFPKIRRKLFEALFIVFNAMLASAM